MASNIACFLIAFTLFNEGKKLVATQLSICAYTFLFLGSPNELFQCQPSNEIFTPDIPDRYFKPSKAAALFKNNTLHSSKPNTSYVYPGSTLGGNCSGTLRGIDYCYHAATRNRNGRRLFTFVLLRQNGRPIFIQIQSHDQDCCTRPLSGFVFCCGSMRREQGVTVSPSIFSFGIFTGPGRLLSFSDTEEEYHADSFEVHHRTMPQSSEEFVTDSLNDHPLLLMRLFIGMFHGGKILYCYNLLI